MRQIIKLDTTLGSSAPRFTINQVYELNDKLIAIAHQKYRSNVGGFCMVHTVSAGVAVNTNKNVTLPVEAYVIFFYDKKPMNVKDLIDCDDGFLKPINSEKSIPEIASGKAKLLPLIKLDHNEIQNAPLSKLQKPESLFAKYGMFAAAAGLSAIVIGANIYNKSYSFK